MKRKIFLGKNPLHCAEMAPAGRVMQMDGEEYYAIANYDRMGPFLMSIVSSGDHWMFISSNGALTAGRGDPDRMLFPYATEDKIHDSAGITGPKTIFIVRRRGKSYLWEPLSDQGKGVYRLRRTIYKNLLGNRVFFEEENDDLQLAFRYGWSNSERFGFIRQARLVNLDGSSADVQLLDGILNLMPCGVDSRMQMEKSVLIDAYKRNELVPETGLGLFALSSIPIDRPEPAESLRTTIAWSTGLSTATHLLSTAQVGRFRRGHTIREETDVRGVRGAYFVRAAISLRSGKRVEWMIGADIECGSSDVSELNRLLRRPAQLIHMVKEDIDRGSVELRRITGCADGERMTGHPVSDARHAANVLFNVMRGGVFEAGYKVETDDFERYVAQANSVVAGRHRRLFHRLRPTVDYAELVARAARSGDKQLERLSRDYLPLTFSRRHGDPSRPWNRFSIPPRDEKGRRVIQYEGNWRDLFQNWEALAVSFPVYTAGMISRFVNASTLDGHNPYRLTNKGIDWEVPTPDDPWGHIGYWGDHQVVYLLKLLEWLHRNDPESLRSLLTREVFAYANVPYRINTYEQLLRNPRETVVYDEEVAKEVAGRVRECGGDGKLVWDARGQVRLVSLTEKLLVSVLARLTNFVPEAGIWMNTQRPEWNDANNALVGNGASMVTLCYLRRLLTFCMDVYGQMSGEKLVISDEVARLLAGIRRALSRHRSFLAEGFNDIRRRRVLDDLGRAGSRYRKAVYSSGLSGRTRPVSVKVLLSFFHLARDYSDQSIRKNRRRDGMYHAYNLLRFDQRDRLPVRRLYEMLEGQVSALSSGILSARESLDVLGALRKSALFRKGQHSYLLYPDRRLPGFMEKNIVPARAVAGSRLLRKLVADGDRSLVERDASGRFHFNGDIRNRSDVERRLSSVAANGYRTLVNREQQMVLELFECAFDHESFTGRSGTFFGYEGLGCIYWHMVSKLLLAVQEVFMRASESGESKAVLRALARRYDDIRDGLGDRKTPGDYGGFPMDPYSHTPGHAGARQPGLTGQVKEDVLCHFGELGLSVREGQIQFAPRLLSESDFLSEPATFRYFDLQGRKRRIAMSARSLAFTCCQVPVIYRLGAGHEVVIIFADGTETRQAHAILDERISRMIFTRSGEVDRVMVSLDAIPAGGQRTA